ncbi:MAG TPA: DUF397 domain-containing protein [Trebonia sp.]
MTDAESTGDAWRKSTASQPHGNCLEVAIGATAVQIRHSQDRSGPVLSFTHAEWHAFLTGARGGECDLPGEVELPGERRLPLREHDH